MFHPALAARPIRPAAVLLLIAAAPAAAQQIVHDTTNRFPSPNPTEFTNQATIGDIDNDGDLDIIFANGGNFSTPGPNQLQRVYVNDGAGFFSDETGSRLGFSGLCRGAEMGDIDDDGDLDLILAQDFNRQPQLFVNDGAGSFSNVTGAQLPAMTLSSSRAQFGDIDNDGDLDLYLTNGGTSNRFGCGQYQVWVNDGAGFFTNETAARHPLGCVSQNMDCIFGDIDQDFDLDVRTASTGSNNSRLYVNDGTGVFTQSTNIPNDSTCYSYDFGDMDGDGDIDLLGANAGSGSTELLLRNSNGTFTNASSQINPNPNQDDNDTKFFDWDFDGDLDMIIARLGSGGEKTYQNNGSGVFTQVFNIITVISDSSLDIMVADLTGNGAFDVVTAQGESGNFQNRIYANNGPPDTLAPRIIRTEQIQDTDDATGPYVFRALILDDMTSDRNFFDKGIELNYTVNDGPVTTLPMKHSGGQVYRGEIPGIPGGGDVEYFVTARDFADNLGTGSSRSFTITSDEIPGDVNGDGEVDVDDLVQVILDWGPCPGEPEPCPSDTNGDGEVDVDDLVTVVLNWT